MGFQKRWQLFFKKNPVFSEWTYGKSAEVIEKEYQALNEKRRAEWFENPKENTLIARMDYLRAQVLLSQEESVR